MSPSDPNGAVHWIATIHDLAPQGYLAFDIKDILKCLGPTLDGCVWVITELDCTGAGAQALCAAVEAGRDRVPVSFSADDLRAAAEAFSQTIDATLIGAPAKGYSQEELQALGRLGMFPETQAELVIRAVDSTLFEVMTKNRHHVPLIKKRFRDVREGDPSDYFGDPSHRLAGGRWGEPRSR